METGRTPAKRLRIFLRDFRMVEATVSLAEGQSLASYFANRRAYVNMLGARWGGSGDDVAHAALRVAQVLWAASPDGDIPLTSVSLAPKDREVEIQLDGGLLVRAGLIMSEQQRLSDYLESAGMFMAVRHAQLLRSGRPPKKVNVSLGDVVINQDAVQAVWEVALQHGSDPAPAAHATVPGPADAR
jgi:hypothetical protein